MAAAQVRPAGLGPSGPCMTGRNSAIARADAAALQSSA
jgi:hypothetical protein